MSSTRAVYPFECDVTELSRKDYHVLFAFGDRHVPHNNPSIDRILLSIMENEKPDFIIDGGDMLSADYLSTFGKRLNQMAGINEDLRADHEWRDRINKIVPDAKKIILVDNHLCRRRDDFTKREDNHFLEDYDGFQIESMLKLKEYGWDLLKEWVWRRRIIFFHGDGEGVAGNSNCPSNKARVNVRKIGMSVVQFHAHATGCELVRMYDRIEHAIQLGSVMDIARTDYIKHNSLGNTTNSVGLFYLPKEHVENTDFYFIPVSFSGHRTFLNGRIYAA